MVGQALRDAVVNRAHTFDYATAICRSGPGREGLSR
ncbi:hypothetical protein CFBP6762_00625 [Xanthomonas arboricola pv. fragariae]|nr:hypothetical protein CFBP6762_00625 [Xanthomonas arboricola pv. fragariae]